MFKEKTQQLKTQYSTKLFFKNEEEIKTFKEKKVKEFVPNRLALKEMLKKKRFSGRRKII